MSLQSLITRLTSITISGSSLKKLTEVELEKILPIPNYFLAARSNLRLLQHINKEEDEITKELLQQLKLSEKYKKLKQVPGIREVLAITIMLEIGEIDRFKTVGDFASYCRCLGSKRVSNGKQKGKNNTKNGNKYLAWAFIEAANSAVRHYPQVKGFYQRKLSKSGSVLAIKSVAHKLARASFCVLKSGKDFEMNKAFK